MLTQSSKTIDEFKYLNLLSADKSLDVESYEDENQRLSNSGRGLVYFGEIEFGNYIMDSAAINYNSGRNYQAAASTNFALGRYRNAMKYIDKAIENGNNYSIGYKAWLLMSNLKEYDEAVVLLDSLEAVDGKPNVAYAMSTTLLKGIAKRKAGKFEESLKEFDEYIATTAEDNPLKIDDYVYWYKGLTYHEMGDLEKAIEEFDLFLEKFQNGPEAHYSKGNVFLQQNKIKEACECYKTAREKIRLGYLRGFIWHEIPDQVYKADVVEKLEKHCHFDSAQ